VETEYPVATVRPSSTCNLQTIVPVYFVSGDIQECSLSTWFRTPSGTLVAWSTAVGGAATSLAVAPPEVRLEATNPTVTGTQSTSKAGVVGEPGHDERLPRSGSSVLEPASWPTESSDEGVLHLNGGLCQCLPSVTFLARRRVPGFGASTWWTMSPLSISSCAPPSIGRGVSPNRFWN
jgi:hypothetical protein